MTMNCFYDVFSVSLLILVAGFVKASISLAIVHTLVIALGFVNEVIRREGEKSHRHTLKDGLKQYLTPEQQARTPLKYPIMTNNP